MSEHRTLVDGLVSRPGSRLPAERRLALAEAGFNAVWRRALVTLGEVTLAAIVGRVLHNARAEHPCLEGLRVTGDGIDCDDLARRWEGLPPAPLAEALADVLVATLQVMGDLTADVLTPLLHEALAAVADADGCQTVPWLDHEGANR